MTLNKFSLLCITAIFILFACVSCASSYKEIPKDITIEELMRNAQTASDKGQYKKAEYFYKEAIEQSSENKVKLLEAKYELAHMYMKKKRYDEAKPIFEELLKNYSGKDASKYPASHQKLIKMDLEKIQAKEEAKNKSNKSK